MATLKAGKVNAGVGLLLHKHKDGGTQWLYHYAIHGRLCETGFCVLRNISLKKARACATGWRSVLHKGRDFM